MSWNQLEVRRSNSTESANSIHNYVSIDTKPIEIYAFIDPLCSECWSLEPYFKKLSIEYGRYLTIRPVISRHLSVLTNNQQNLLKSMEKDDRYPSTLHVKYSNKKRLVLFPWIALAIKTAELQGKNAGRNFLRKIQEVFFLERKNITSEEVLIQCAKEACLDVEEFKNDLFSVPAKNAYHADLKITKEMDVHSSPTLVLFNHFEVDHGIKITGTYTYETYVHILKRMLKNDLQPAKKTTVLDFLAFYQTTTNREIAIIFDWSLTKATQELRKLQIKQQATVIKKDHVTYWKYTGEKTPR